MFRTDLSNATPPVVLTYEDIEREVQRLFQFIDLYSEPTEWAEYVVERLVVHFDLDASSMTDLVPGTGKLAAIDGSRDELYRVFLNIRELISTGALAQVKAAKLAKALVVHYSIPGVVSAPDDKPADVAREHIRMAGEFVGSAGAAGPLPYDVLEAAISLLGAVLARMPNRKKTTESAILRLAGLAEVGVTLDDGDDPIASAQDHLRAANALLGGMDAPF